jgi:hypothetical protein
LFAACAKDPTGGVPLGTPRSGLLALAHFDSFPPPSPVSVNLTVNTLKQVTIQHSDSLGTAFLSFTFTPHSVVFRHDSTLADTSTVTVTVTIAPGGYEFTFGPAYLGFNLSSKPTVTVSYTRYANPAVFDSSSRYASAGAFEQALGLWFERLPDRWFEEGNAHTGQTVSAALEAPGRYLLAAPK